MTNQNPCKSQKSGRAQPVHHEGDPCVLLRLEPQRVRRRLRSAIDTSAASAASALSGTVKPALRRPFHENSATTMRHQNAGRRLEIDHYGMGAGAEPGDCPTCR
jgi:hypothetical protein